MTVLVAVDRIEEQKATLITQEKEPWRVTWPLRLLPAGVQEGDILRIYFEQDKAAAEDGKKEAAALLSGLIGEV